MRQVTEKSLWTGRVEWLANSSTSIIKNAFCGNLTSISAVPSYLDAKDFATLRQMYELFGRVDGVGALRVAFRDYIKVYSSLVIILGVLLIQPLENRLGYRSRH